MTLNSHSHPSIHLSYQLCILNVLWLFSVTHTKGQIRVSSRPKYACVLFCFVFTVEVVFLVKRELMSHTDITCKFHIERHSLDRQLLFIMQPNSQILMAFVQEMLHCL